MGGRRFEKAPSIAGVAAGIAVAGTSTATGVGAVVACGVTSSAAACTGTGTGTGIAGPGVSAGARRAALRCAKRASVGATHIYI